MTAAMKIVLGSLATCAVAQQDPALLLQSSVDVDSVSGERGSVTVTESFELNSMMDLKPEWCKNETELTWKQRKERMQQHATLLWCKTEVKKIREKNDTVPVWMDKVVNDDENKGRMKWAVQESKRLKAEQKEVPEWIAALVEEDTKWGNRWAACKAAQLKAANEEVPEWMAENGRKGIMEYASEKAQDIQEQIEEVDDEMHKETAIVQSNGDPVLAKQRLLARTRETKVRSAAQQMQILSTTLSELDKVGEFAKKGEKPQKVKHAIAKAKEASDLLNQILARKEKTLQMVESVA